MKDLKLNAISASKLEKKEMIRITGGTCGCACANASTMTNGSANAEHGYYSPGDRTDQMIFLDELVVKRNP